MRTWSRYTYVPWVSRYWKHFSKMGGTLITPGGTRFAKGTPNWLLAAGCTDTYIIHNIMMLLNIDQTQQVESMHSPWGCTLVFALSVLSLHTSCGFSCSIPRGMCTHTLHTCTCTHTQTRHPHDMYICEPKIGVITFTYFPTLQEWYELGAVLTHSGHFELLREKPMSLVNLKLESTMT